MNCTNLCFCLDVCFVVSSCFKVKQCFVEQTYTFHGMRALRFLFVGNTKVFFTVNIWYCSFAKSDPNSNILTRTNTPFNVLLWFLLFWKKLQRLGNYPYELPPPALTTDSFRKDVAKNCQGLSGLSRVRCRHRYFNLFGFWFRIETCQLGANLFNPSSCQPKKVRTNVVIWCHCMIVKLVWHGFACISGSQAPFLWSS